MDNEATPIAIFAKSGNPTLFLKSVLRDRSIDLNPNHFDSQLPVQISTMGRIERQFPAVFLTLTDTPLNLHSGSCA